MARTYEVEEPNERREHDTAVYDKAPGDGRVRGKLEVPDSDTEEKNAANNEHSNHRRCRTHELQP